MEEWYRQHQYYHSKTPRFHSQIVVSITTQYALGDSSTFLRNSRIDQIVEGSPEHQATMVDSITSR